MELMLPGQQVGQTVLGYGSGSVLEIEVGGRQALLGKFNRIGLNIGVFTLLHEYYQESLYVNLRLFQYNVTVLFLFIEIYGLVTPTAILTTDENDPIALTQGSCSLLSNNLHCLCHIPVLGDAEQIITHLGLFCFFCKGKWWHSVVFKFPFSSGASCFSVCPALIGL